MLSPSPPWAKTTDHPGRTLLSKLICKPSSPLPFLALALSLRSKHGLLEEVVADGLVVGRWSPDVDEGQEVVDGIKEGIGKDLNPFFPMKKFQN
ncbi:hypothetical protein RHSIM_Rhsim12G0043500 [Rhododendron simsii]|uniref:Uncharacterized protein n=1 Tax=Rhododendron simsii TaxID=118357 RepID=A0A834G7V4_RHOSS|nr:hypothetical protein RHSIM_Rhsim12G0043500 [Rhododendron simsii]